MHEENTLNSKKSLSKNLSILLIIGVSLVSLIATMLVYNVNKNYMVEQFDKKSTSITEQLSHILINSVWHYDIKNIELASKAYSLDPAVIEINIVDSNSELIHNYKSILKKTIIKKNNFIYKDGFITKSRLIIFEKNIIGKVEVSFSKHVINKELAKILLTNIVLLLITLISISVLTFTISKMLLKKPIESLVKKTNEFGKKTFKINNRYKEFEPLSNVLSKMNKKISKQVELLNNQKKELEFLLTSFDENIVSSKTNRYGVITYVSKAFCLISEYEEKELIGKTHKVIKHHDLQENVFREMWRTINAKKIWKGQIKNKNKNGKDYWIDTVIRPELNIHGDIIGYSEISQNITAQKEVYELSFNLEKKVEERTKQLSKDKQFISSIMNSQNSMVITSNGEKVTTVNKAFADFFKIKDQNNFFAEYEGNVEYSRDNSAIFYLKECAESVDWLNYIYENQNQVHKIKLKENIFTITIDKFIFEDEGLFTLVLTDITELEKIRNEIEDMNQHTRESIEYSALIQNALIPAKDSFENYFDEHFLIWKPKDIVGGDIYLFEHLRNKDECLIMLIDCTGHGVPGAFVTMLVKAIEKQITTIIKTSNEPVNTSNILKEFNKEMKSILEHKGSKSEANAGFDGAILYFNKKEKIIRYSGARIPLYYTQGNDLISIKGDRHSVGYNHSDINYEFTQHEIVFEKGMSFYVSTDGFIDQSGGDSGFSFGRKRFENMIIDHKEEKLELQKDIFLDRLDKYQKNDDTYDDITFISLKL